MAFFARSPKKKPSPKKYAKDWKAESDAETDAAARLNKVMAKLEGITPERDEKSLEAAYALTQAVADVSLGDVWSEIRRACARGVARVPLDGPRRARLAAVFSGQLRVTTDWRRADGLCTALKGLATHEPSPPCAALHDALLAAAEAAVVPVALAHESAPVREAASRALDAVAERAASAEAAERLLGAVGAALTAALEAQAAEGGADGKRPADAAAPTPDRERRAAALAGLLGGAARLVPRARAAALESGGLVDVGRLAGLLAHDASTVRQAASVCLQRVGAKSEGLGDVALGAIDVARRPDDWRWTEGALMAYDGVLSDEASAATARLGDAGGPSAAFLERLLRGAWDWLLATLGEEGSFEVRRAARQLAFSAARADFAFDALGPPGAGGLGFLVDPTVPPSHRALGARLLAHGVSFGRFCDETLADAECTPLFRKWGLSHEGAGGDSEAVSKAEKAVRDAARARPAALRRRVGALRLAVLGAVPRLAQTPPEPAAARKAEHLPEAAAPPREPQEARLLVVRGLAFCAAAARDAHAGPAREGRFGAARDGAFDGGDAALHGAADWPLLRLAPAETRRLAEPALAELVAGRALAAGAGRALTAWAPPLLAWLAALDGAAPRGDRDDARAASRRFVVDALAVLLRAALGRAYAPDRPPPEPLAACADRALGGLFRAVSFRGAADDLSPRKRKFGVARAVVADVPPGAPAAGERGEAATAAAFVARSLADRLVGAKGRKDADLSARLLGALALAALLSACDGSSDAFYATAAAVASGASRGAPAAAAGPAPATPTRASRPPRAAVPAIDPPDPPATPVTPASPSAEDPPDDWDDWDDDDDAPDCGGGDEDDDALDAERALTAAIDAEAAKDGRCPPFYSSFEPGAATSAGKPLLPSLAFF